MTAKDYHLFPVTPDTVMSNGTVFKPTFTAILKLPKSQPAPTTADGKAITSSSPMFTASVSPKFQPVPTTDGKAVKSSTPAAPSTRVYQPSKARAMSSVSPTNGSPNSPTKWDSERSEANVKPPTKLSLKSTENGRKHDELSSIKSIKNGRKHDPPKNVFESLNEQKHDTTFNGRPVPEEWIALGMSPEEWAEELLEIEIEESEH